MNYIFDGEIGYVYKIILFSNKEVYCIFSHSIEDDIRQILNETTIEHGWTLSRANKNMFSDSKYVGKKTDEELIEWLEEMLLVEELKK
jgi:hypothetical protein